MSDEELLRGSWRLVSFEARRSNGEVTYPFGGDADGVLTYTSDARVSATVWAPDRQPFASGDPANGTDAENAAALATIVQYVGTFEVDQDAGTVVHHVEQSVFPNWNGVDQVRFYTLGDDNRSLDLATPPILFDGDMLVSVLVWRRLSSP